MMELLGQLIKSFWFILILTVGIGQEFTTGCMDDGYQQWSPNPGSPACNYDQLAIIEGDCLYNDCTGECGGSAVEDCAGECGGNDSTCSDCNGVPNGTAYINPLCIDDINVNGCVGGNTGSSDCLSIDLFFEGLLVSDSTEIIKVFVTNLDTLKSLDIEFQYDSSILNITKFSLDGTALSNIYNIEDTTFVKSDNFLQTDFTLYFEPHTSDAKLFSVAGREHIFNIVLEAPFEIPANTTAQIIINKLSVNEILMDDSNWVGGEISVIMHSGCTDEAACNYDQYAGNDDGSCLYDDACGVCDGDETIAHNCGCTDANEYDCIGYCILDDCPDDPDELSFNPGCAFFDPNCSNVCIGGATERYPCEQDCEAILLSTEEWGGTAYEDNCGVCISEAVETVIPGELDSLDCFNSDFKIYDSNGIEEDTLKESDIFYVALHMQNLPDLLEGVIIDINFEESLSFIDANLDPSEFDTELTILNLLDSSYKLFYETSNNGVLLADIYLENTNISPQGNEGNILFLQFSNLGINGDSTVISYNEILINEHAMKEQNYTSQVIYFGDCSGIFNGQTLVDECNVCGGDGSSCAVYVESTITSTVDATDLEDMETFENNFESLLENSMGLPNGTVMVTGVVIVSPRSISIQVEVNFSITLTAEELAETDFISIEDFENFLVGVEDEIENGGIQFIYGCSDENGCNYNIDVTIDDGSCTYPPEGDCDCAGNTPEDLFAECVGVLCDCDGNLSIIEILIPQHYLLSQNYPNPFNPITYIHYSVPNYDFINIDIIDISGQIIKTIVQSSHQPGNYEIMWDGTNHHDISVPSGIYFYKMDTDEFVSVKKLVLLK